MSLCRYNVRLRVPCVAVFVWTMLFASLARAAEPLAMPVDGDSFPAKLVSIDAQWRITFRTGQQDRSMPAADLVRWGECPVQGRAGGLVLADGSWLAAELVAADPDVLSAESDTFGSVKLPRNAIRGCILRPCSNQADRDKLFDRMFPTPSRVQQGENAAANPKSPDAPEMSPTANAAASSDVLLLDNGDELPGRLLSIADGSAQFQTDVGPIDVKVSRITAILFQRPDMRDTDPQAFRVWAGFADGSRLLVTQLTVENDSLNLTVFGQSPIVLHASASSSLVFLQPLGPRVAYLSDLTPTEYRQTPYLALAWPLGVDRNVAGGFLRAGGRLCLKGLGVHSAARLVYNLGNAPDNGIAPRRAGERPEAKAAGGFDRFRADLAIDDSTDGGGSVVFRVLVDGQERYVSPTIRGGVAPTPISVDIRGAKRLELIVDYADRADVLDHADWLDARLTR